MCNLALAVLCVVLASSLFAQTTDSTTQTDLQAQLIIQKSAIAQMGNNAVQDVQLKGTVVLHTGAGNHGSITLSADSGGQSRVFMNLDSGSRAEYSSGHAEDPACTWTDAEGKVHDAAIHNCWTDGAWFFPTMSIAAGQQQGKTVIAYKGRAQRADSAVDQIVTSRSVANLNIKQKPSSTDFIKKLSTQSIYFDSVTGLPASITFATHPDDDAGKDIPVEIRFSDYRDVNGVKVPFHIEKFFNGSLLFEISVESASYNTGSLAKQ